MISNYVAPSIKIIDDAFNFSDKIIDLVTDERVSWDNSLIASDGGKEEKRVRNSKEIQISVGLDYPLEFFLLAQTTYSLAREYAKENNISFSHMEDISVLKYEPFEGFYSSHADAGPMMPRIMSALIYLNDVDKGGETYFDKFDLSISPKAGRIALFPSNYAYSHAAKPPESNRKFVAVTWFGMELIPEVFGNYYV